MVSSALMWMRAGLGLFGVVCPHVDEDGLKMVGLFGVVCPHVDEGGPTNWGCSVSCPHVDEDLMK